MRYDIMVLAIHARLNTLHARGYAMHQGLLIADAVVAGGGSYGRAIAEAVRAAKRSMKLKVESGTIDIENVTEPLTYGDHVLATKFSDGDPRDQWCVGFFHSTLPRQCGDRCQVVDGNGNFFRGNGFRRAQKIRASEGQWLLDHAGRIDASDLSLWDWLATARAEVANV